MGKSEQARVAGIIVDVLDLMGCDREDMVEVGRLVQKHAHVLEHYREEEMHEAVVG